MDKMVRISSSLRSCTNFLRQNNILADRPDCDKCGMKMDSGKGGGFDSKGYSCSTCFTRKSIRYGSFLNHSSCSLQEFVRTAFFYFLKNYDPDLAHREMTENSTDGVGCGTGKTAVFAVYAHCRERISRHQIYIIQKQKLGGPGREVVVDFMKLHLRNKKSTRQDEWLILGMMERDNMAGGRCRAYIVPNIKIQTVALYMSKTIANKSILFTPFYAETGWEFLDKFFDHKRLTRTKGNVPDYWTEQQKWINASGFGSMWKNIKGLDMTYLRHTQEMKKYGQISENLQMFVDEQVWRTEHKTADQRRQALALAFNCEHWKDENKKGVIPLGIGGGYGQFGILTEDEFLKVLKTSGKRIQRFNANDESFVGNFGRGVGKCRKLDNGLDIIVDDKKNRVVATTEIISTTDTSQINSSSKPTAAATDDFAEDNYRSDDDYLTEPKKISSISRPEPMPDTQNQNNPFHLPNRDRRYDQPDVPTIDIEAVAKKRFGFDKDKIQETLNMKHKELNNVEEILD